MLSSILTRDIPVLLGLFVLVSVAVIAANLLTDRLCLADPRSLRGQWAAPSQSA
jgi:ABC-type dipeptide/oligopeptide/nickel transport system permease component